MGPSNISIYEKNNKFAHCLINTKGELYRYDTLVQITMANWEWYVSKWQCICICKWILQRINVYQFMCIKYLDFNSVNVHVVVVKMLSYSYGVNVWRFS